MPDNAKFAQIVREYLEQPRNEVFLRAFFDLIFHLTRSYLRVLRTRGWRLPIEEFSVESAMDDLALDVLSHLQESEAKLPFHLLLDYLAPRIHSGASDQTVVALTKGALSNHIRQCVSDLVWGRRPEQAKIRRRIREITDGPGYLVFDDSRTAMVRWMGAVNPPREECAAIGDNELYPLVAVGVRTHSQMPTRCEAVFRALDQVDRVRNALPRFRLVQMFCRVLDDFSVQSDWVPEMAGVDHVQARARHLAQQAIEETICGRFAALESKKAFNEEVRNSYATALANLTNDLIAHGEHDLLPRYLKEQLGRKEEGRYLDVHKHSWETSVKTCLDRLRELLRAEGLEPE